MTRSSAARAAAAACAPSLPLSEDELRHTFLDCAHRRLDESRARQLNDTLMNLDDVRNLAALVPQLCPETEGTLQHA